MRLEWRKPEKANGMKQSEKKKEMRFLI
jgi:hypothetical protein